MARVAGTSVAARRKAAKTSGKPTIREVAERAHVAISTVSRVLNGGPASQRLSRKVRRAVEELGYVPSVAAQSLVGRRAGCIGLTVNSTQSPWFFQILAGVEEGLLASRKSVILASMVAGGEYDPAQVRGWIQQARVDGIVMVRHSTRDQQLIEMAQAARLPVVLFAPDLDVPQTLAVRCNNLEAGRLAAIHLTELGHKNVAFVGGPQDSLDTRMRLTGLEQALGERGIAVPASQIWFAADYGADQGPIYAQKYLAIPQKQRPTAVVCGNDTIALAFMRQMLVNGMRIPDDISVVGFDGTYDGAQFWPGLTTVEQPTRQMAAFACQALLRAIDAPADPLTSTEFPVRMIVRDSTGAPSRR